MIRNTLFTTAAVIALGLAGPAMAADQNQSEDLNTDMEVDSDQNQGSTSLTGQLPEGDGTFGSESELEGMKYSDVQGRTVYSADNTEIGTVETVHVDQQGNPDGLIVRGTGDYERADARIFMPIAGVRPGQGDDVDLQADVTDEELTSIMNKQAAGTGRGTLDKDLTDE